MYDEQLEKLMEMALMDGELTEKEKQILFKKAESFGIDLDEFEMVLDARLFEKQQSMQKQPPTPAVVAAPKSDKFGDVKKCPACGAMIQSFQTKCSDCGHEFSSIGANSTIQKLFEMLNDAEAKRKGEGGALKAFLATGFGGIGDKINNSKKDIIKNFPIPNAKEDILEFLSLAIPNAKKAGNFFNANQPEIKQHNEFQIIWRAKCEQIILKARFSMKEDKKTLEEIEYYAKQLGIK